MPEKFNTISAIWQFGTKNAGSRATKKFSYIIWQISLTPTGKLLRSQQSSSEQRWPPPIYMYLVSL